MGFTLLIRIRKAKQHFFQAAIVMGQGVKGFGSIPEVIDPADHIRRGHRSAGNQPDQGFKVLCIGIAASEEVQLLLQQDGMQEGGPWQACSIHLRKVADWPQASTQTSKPWPSVISAIRASASGSFAGIT